MGILSESLKPTLKLFHSDFEAEEIYPDLPNGKFLTNELEAFMWLWMLNKYSNTDKPDVHFLYEKTTDFIKLRTHKEFLEHFSLVDDGDFDAPIGRTIYVNQKFAPLYSREAFTDSVFVLDNRTTLHVGNTYKYLSYSEILTKGSLSGDRFAPVSFSLLTDLWDGSPAMSLYAETVASIFVDRTDPYNVIWIIMDKYTAIVIFHRLYSLCQEQLLILVNRQQDAVPCSGDPNNLFVKEFHRIFRVIKSMREINSLREELLTEDWKD